jgi:hypothetical protein
MKRGRTGTAWANLKGRGGGSAIMNMNGARNLISVKGIPVQTHTTNKHLEVLRIRVHTGYPSLVNNRLCNGLRQQLDRLGFNLILVPLLVPLLELLHVHLFLRFRRLRRHPGGLLRERRNHQRYYEDGDDRFA